LTKLEEDINEVLRLIETYKTSMTEFDEDQMDLIIDALVFYKEMQVI